MRKRSAEEKQKQLERFLMNVAEAADAALWEYWREKEAEYRRAAELTQRGDAAFHTGRPFLRRRPYANRLLSACRTAADAAERIYSWHFSIAQ